MIRPPDGQNGMLQPDHAISVKAQKPICNLSFEVRATNLFVFD